jgi:hypothetical protein
MDSTAPGFVTGEHTYSTTGLKNVDLCLVDQDGAQGCISTALDVRPLVMLGFGTEVPDEPVADGVPFTHTIEILNAPRAGGGGLTAEEVRLRAIPSPDTTIRGAVPASGACAIIDDAVECEFGSMAPDERVAIAIELETSGDLLRDAFPSLELEASTSTAALEDVFDGQSTSEVIADLTDTDGDGMTDVFERVYGFVTGTNDAGSDADGDGVANGDESALGTNPRAADSDGDGLSDGTERDVTFTEPTLADTDGDGLPDGWETDQGLDAFDVFDAGLDVDGDGVDATGEFAAGTDPHAADTDDDGLDDGAELAAGTDPADAQSPPDDPAIVLASAVLPASRSVVVGTTATAFATILNAGMADAVGCRIRPAAALPAEFFFQTTNPATNAPTGTRDASVGILAGGSQTFYFGITPQAAFDATPFALQFGCANSGDALTIAGVNDLLLAASDVPVPDVVALVATVLSDGIVHLPGALDSAAFSVATANVGAAGPITIRVDTGGAALPVTISVCRTEPATGVCVQPEDPTPSPFAVPMGAGTTATFAVFVTGSGVIAPDPAGARVFVRFADAGGVVRGATSVAVQTD